MHSVIDDDFALDAVSWVSRVMRFIQGLSDETVAVDRHIRKAYHLQCLAPLEFRRLMVPSVAEAQIEAMLERGGYGCAVERITGVAAESSFELVGAAETGGRAPVGEVLSFETIRHNGILTTLETWASGFLRLRPVVH